MVRVMTGCRLLNTWIRASGSSNRKLAETIGCDASRVSRWRTAVSRPELPQAMALEHVTGIPLAAWLTGPESRALAKLGRAS